MPKKKIALPAWHKQKHMAEALELDPAYLSRILSGKEYLTEDNALRMSAYFEVLVKDVTSIQDTLRKIERKPESTTDSDTVKWFGELGKIKDKIEKRFVLLQQKL